jgi:hypothetical protein
MRKLGYLATISVLATVMLASVAMAQQGGGQYDGNQELIPGNQELIPGDQEIFEDDQYGAQQADGQQADGQQASGQLAGTGGPPILPLAGAAGALLVAVSGILAYAAVARRR